MKAFAFLALLCILPAAMAWSWDSCGTRYDRLKTKTLDFTASPGLVAGATATITITGSTDLHVDLEAGAWQVRVYEIGKAHPIYTTFGDLLTALHFDDRLNTTYTMTVSFTLPAPVAANNFTISLISSDQQHATYNCLEITYQLGTGAETNAVAKVNAGPVFWSCGAPGDMFHLSGIAISPNPPVKGEPVTIAASGSVFETVTAGTLHFTVALDGIQLISKTKDLCSILHKANLTCPVRQGSMAIKITETLPSWAPSGNYSAKGVAQDQNGKELACLQGWFML